MMVNDLIRGQAETFRYRAPLGPLGALADRLFLERSLRGFLSERARYLKRVAESGQAAAD